MKKFFLTICVAMFSLGTFAQSAGDMAWGVHGLYGFKSENFGVGAIGQYNITDPIRIEAGADFWFKKYGVYNFDVQANAQYLIPIAGALKVYPMAGLGYMRWHSDGATYEDDNVKIKVDGASGGDIFFNLGAGAQYDLGDNMAFKVELRRLFKYGGQFCLFSGITFKL